MTEESPKVFTEELINEILKSKSPIDQFKHLAHLVAEKDSKVTSITSSFFIDSLTYFKYQYNFSIPQLSVLMDILLQLLQHSVKTSNFSKSQDIAYLESLLLTHSQGMSPLFPSENLTQILNHLALTYFNHYNLYKFIFTVDRSQENISKLLDIDIPLPKPAHASAVQRIAKPTTAPLVVQEPVKEVEVVHAKESLKERLLKSLDENIREKYLEKISEARESMARQLEQRDKMLKQKWEDLEKELKRKRRRG